MGTSLDLKAVSLLTSVVHEASRLFKKSKVKAVAQQQGHTHRY